MCGISGIFDPHGGRPDADLLQRMNETLHHRGPDDSGFHVETGVALGHRRLSIIDVAAGRQPLFNEDNSVVVVFNGEIYNFQELSTELVNSGHQFRTHSDTEVIVHGWEEWGEACVERFRGMFAFALWDRNRRTLFLARDRLGIKPLYYSQLPKGHWIFGSELKALQAHPDLSRRIDAEAVEDYFAYGYIPEPKTIFAGVRKLEPGHTLQLRLNADGPPSPRQYWDVPFSPIAHSSEGAVAEELLARLDEAVRLRLVAEVPLGAFLSGGVDSSAVVASMALQMNEPVKTCAIAFGHTDFDESAHAAVVAARYHTDHVVDRVDPGDFSLVGNLAHLFDEPFADASALPTYRLCEAARRRVTVALSGDGGDENLAGYRRYRLHLNEERMRGLLPLAVRRPLFGVLGRLYPKADWAPRMFRAKTTFESLARDTVAGYFHGVSRMTDSQRRALFSASLRRDLDGYHAAEVLRRHAAAAPTDDPLSLVQYIDLKTFLVSILHKVDRASMAHGLEVRVPLLDHKLVEWLSGLSPRMKLRQREGKYVFKTALRQRVPAELMYRPKMGFSLPLAAWFRGPLRQQVREQVLGQTLADSGLFNGPYLAKLVNEHEQARRDHSAVLWELLMFGQFLSSRAAA